MTDITPTLYQHPDALETTLSLASKISLALYSVTSYLTGVAGLVAFILSMGGLVPMGQWLVITHNPVLAVVINILLIGLFGLQHSLMARPFFKRHFHRWFGVAGERSTYVWSTGVVLFVILALWQPLDGALWQAQSLMAQVIMWGLFLFGWSYLFAATFAINHWDLFGLRQVWLAVTDTPYQPPAFKESWMYRYSRHPIMLGALIGMWCLPTMATTQLVMTLCMTAYIVVGVMLEERDLVAQFGARYQEYKQRVGMFFSLR